MDAQILETIRDFYGDLHGVTTQDFYIRYIEICTKYDIVARQKNVVIREACDALGLKTKQKTYTVFCEGD